MRNKYTILFAAAILLWLKTYVVYQIEFNLPVENPLQEFILFFNPLSSAILFLAFSLFFSGKAQKRAMLIIHLISSSILYANVVYYRNFDDFITLPVLAETKNFGDLGSSALTIMKPYDIFYFLDFILLIFIVKFVKYNASKASRKSLSAVFAVALVCLVVNVALADIQRPQLLTRTFDREKLVKLLGSYNYQIYDAALHLRTNAQKAFADSNDLVEIYNFTQSNYVEPNPKFKGVAKGKNVIVVSMESLQNFTIGYKLHGEPVTPFLNSLSGNGWFRFDNFYHEVGQGKTSDAEFMFETGLYPLPAGAVFTTNAQNEYNALPERLGNHGYYSAVFHGNNASFWNRDIMYDTIGYDHYYAADAFYQAPENSVNYGIKDIPFFNQSMRYLENLPEPFYTKYISLTNHFPFKLDNPQDIYIQPANTGDPTVDNYFQTVRYLDEALKTFIHNLKEDGLYQNSVIIMYGDHYGISTNHNKAMKQITGTEMTPYDIQQLQRVPLFIHIPGMDGKTLHTVGGEIDLKPTLLHLLGISTKDHINFGSGLFSKDRPEFVAERDGSFVTGKYVYTSINGQCYKKPSGEKVDKKQCKPFMKKAKTELRYSDKVVYGDLLRFLEEILSNKLGDDEKNMNLNQMKE
ncbi:MAG TPA: LTA synthase family protein [Bacillales bacterium]|nr:LTA synthase family protein [Bacillales bacterium]